MIDTFTDDLCKKERESCLKTLEKIASEFGGGEDLSTGIEALRKRGEK